MYLLARRAFGPLLKSYLLGRLCSSLQHRHTKTPAASARLLRRMQRLTSQADFLVFPAVDGAPAAARRSPIHTANSPHAIRKRDRPAACACRPRPAGSGTPTGRGGLSDGRLLALGEHLVNLHPRGK